MFSVEWRIGKAPNPKLQAPEKLQIPSTKTSLSRRVKRPTPTRVVKRASHADFGLWSSGFFWSLELGLWSFFPSVAAAEHRANSAHDSPAVRKFCATFRPYNGK